MQSAYSHPQAPGQYPFALNSGGVSPPRAPDSMTPSFVQTVAPKHNARTYTHWQGGSTYRDPIPVHTGPERGDNLNVYGGSSIPGYDFNYARVEPSGPPAFQPPNHGGYMMPNVQYGSVGQVEVNYAGRQPAIDQFSRRTMNFSPLPAPPGEYTVPNNQEASPLWCLGNCWISYVSEDELHLTIALKKSPFA